MHPAATALTVIVKAPPAGPVSALLESAKAPSPADFKGGALLNKDVGLLEAALPGHAGTATLSAAARAYLAEATGTID